MDFQTERCATCRRALNTRECSNERHRQARAEWLANLPGTVKTPSRAWSKAARKRAAKRRRRRSAH